MLPAHGNKPLSRPAHALTFDAVIEELGAHQDTGLSGSEAKQRRETYGNNDLGDGPGVQPGKILIRQVANAMTLACQSPFLIFLNPHAQRVSSGIGSYIEGGVVAAVIILNIVVGFR
ncbi:hypothetical protein CERZMDRAFT_43500 [Cercospora zeae-maydis SCOH1-5]|uniref:Cation-transporting P-type ATPase N-terminal domain-containing protein n=1 Tax=Cercospora zeae-maydis SCOH1-5 TaxID=717836 RepID=A0A6A6FCL0_9PEZI|nr:hypothetical protein CERZMDRAFT_43500 [Cercospora zeae-maydis SCOH1-5]